MPAFQVEQVNLAATIGTVPRLQNISFQVSAGEFIAIVGPSGAGKTSLLRLFNRLSDPSSGSIYLEQQDIRQIPPLQLRRQIMLVMQEPKLLEMSVQAALAYPLQLQGFSQTAIHQRLAFWQEQLQIPQDWLSRTALQLSVGQRQWIAIARALIAQPTILLLDEPTSALDLGRASQLLALLATLSQTQPMIVLMVNHQLDLVQQFCSRILYLNQGQLQQDAPSSQIDWDQLRQNLLQRDAQDLLEWSTISPNNESSPIGKEF